MANKSVAKKRLATAQSLASAFQTEVTNVENLDTIAWTVATSSVTANSGTFAFQIRMKDATTNQTGTWIDLAFDPVPTLAGANATFNCFATQIEASEARLVFTPGGGSPNGTAEIWVKASRRGA
jgi:uncharacterized membrane protein